MACKILAPAEQIYVCAPFMSALKSKKLEELPNVKVSSLSSRRNLLRLVFSIVERNEAMLWGVSWLMEALFSANSSLITNVNSEIKNGQIINMAYTVTLRCDLLWNQATPPLETLKVMATENVIAKILLVSLGWCIKILDSKVRKKLLSKSAVFANNSSYLGTLYSGIRTSDAIIHVPKEFKIFDGTNTEPSRDFVLAYIGKETEVDTIVSLARAGVRIISFGAKIPFGTSIGLVKELTDFRGYVSDDDLALLYYNALYTVFPFTEEPFGWVPLESMYYGTPVLSYKKQGPSETILD